MINLFLASAGSGKTTFLVKQANASAGHVLIVTFTQENERSIKTHCIKQFGMIPDHIEICTWFSFLLRDWIRPYQTVVLDDKKIQGIILDNGMFIDYISPEKDPLQFYLTTERRIHSSRISKLAFHCQERSLNVLPRLQEIYTQIFIDEVQDLSGYDYDLVVLMGGDLPVTCVGDYRQKTYTTHKEPRNKNIETLQAFCKNEAKIDLLKLDKSSLNGSYRCIQPILNFASLVFNDTVIPITRQNQLNPHSGCYLVSEADVDDYLSIFTDVVQLTYNRTSHASNVAPRYNMGDSKGLEFDHVLIWPTDPINLWLIQETVLKKTILTKLYVSITRARFSVAFVWKHNDIKKLRPIMKTYISYWENS
jgi:DNA helicase II / ATP-dependent DNA helicase PcrA